MTLQAPGIIVNNLEPSKESSIIIFLLKVYIAEVNDEVLYLLMYQNLRLMQQYQYDTHTQTIRLIFVLSLFCNYQI